MLEVQLLFKGSQMDLEIPQTVKTLTLQTNTNITVNWFRYHIPPVDSISSKTCAATTLAHMGASKVLQ